MIIRLAKSNIEIESCFECINQLRPHLTLGAFVEAVERMSKSNGYQLAYVDINGVKAVAGFRVSEWLHTGTYLEIEELITYADSRSQGVGGKLFDWLYDYASQNNCNQIRLISGVKRTDAHKFYERKGMVNEAKYFSIDVSPSI